MRLLEHPAYRRKVEAVVSLPLPWEKLRGKRVAVSGATGMIGHFLVDVLLYREIECQVLALGRSREKARACFQEYWGSPFFRFVPWDFRDPPSLGQVDFVLHLASTTHPRAYATQPIETILLNVEGLKNLLDAACQSGAERFLFASSCEIYGEPLDEQPFTETSCGYIDCNTLRAGYPESKRAGEALCQAYLAEKGLSVVIPRFSRIYGPTMLPTDTKALSQFLQKAAGGEDIVLKSQGRQVYSYTHVADAVAGLLYCLLLGDSGEAYNVAGEPAALRELAEILADFAGTQVVFQLPEAVEQSGYSVVKRSVLDTAKLEGLGWKPRFSVTEGIRETVAILKDREPGNRARNGSAQETSHGYR